jgi:hypothetical protein
MHSVGFCPWEADMSSVGEGDRQKRRVSVCERERGGRERIHLSRPLTAIMESGCAG